VQWINEPKNWKQDGHVLHVTTEMESDFWNNTFYGFVHGNGHLYSQQAEDDFSAVVSFRADYTSLYDQAGLMLRVDEDNWIKAGIEYTDDELHFSVVVTRDGQSDWSMTPLSREAASGLELRLTRHSEAVRVQFRLPAAKWRLARLAYLAMPSSVSIGPMCCSPTREGLEVEFTSFEVGPPIPRDLHES
jgi:uncharacterized protein